MAAALPDHEVTPPALWDVVVRVSHWAIAVVVLMAAIFTKGGSTVHVWAGWIGMAVLVLRLVWGVVGRPEARFSAFPPNPMAALRHLGDLIRGRPRHYASHNPAGAMMTYALWAALVAVMVTGLIMTSFRTPIEIAAQNAAVEAGDWGAMLAAGGGVTEDSPFWAEVKHTSEWLHVVTSDLIMVLVVIHVLGVLVESLAMRRNLLWPMLFRRRGDPG